MSEKLNHNLHNILKNQNLCVLHAITQCSVKVKGMNRDVRDSQHWGEAKNI